MSKFRTCFMGLNFQVFGIVFSWIHLRVQCGMQAGRDDPEWHRQWSGLPSFHANVEQEVDLLRWLSVSGYGHPVFGIDLLVGHARSCRAPSHPGPVHPVDSVRAKTLSSVHPREQSSTLEANAVNGWYRAVKPSRQALCASAQAR